MEKFGIFNILSALNSFVGGTEGKNSRQAEGQNTPAEKKPSGENYNPSPPPMPAAYEPMLDIIIKQQDISRRIDEVHNKKPPPDNIIKKYKI